MMVIVVVVLAVPDFSVVLVVVAGCVVVVAMSVGSIGGGHMRGPMGAVVMAAMVGGPGDYGGMVLVVGGACVYYGGVMMVVSTGPGDYGGVMVGVVSTGPGDYGGMMVVVSACSGDNGGVVGVVTAGPGNVVGVGVEALLLPHVLDEALELSVLLLDEVDVRLELVAGGVVGDLDHLDLGLPLDLVLELVPLLGVLVEGVSELLDLVGDGVLLVLGVLDPVVVDGGDVLLEVGDLVGEGLVLGLELGEVPGALLEVVDLPLGDVLAPHDGVEGHLGLPLVHLEDALDLLEVDVDLLFDLLLALDDVVDDLLVVDLDDLLSGDPLHDPVDPGHLDDLLEDDLLVDVDVLVLLDDLLDLVLLLLDALLDLRNLDYLLYVEMQVVGDGGLHNSLLGVRGILELDLGLVGG